LYIGLHRNDKPLDMYILDLQQILSDFCYFM
jgi:hypothetical protein